MGFRNEAHSIADFIGGGNYWPPMKDHLRSAIILVGIALFGQLSAKDSPQDAAIKQMARETLGDLKLEMTEKALIKVLGEPKTKGKEIKWEAIDLFVQQWEYPALGLELQMAAQKQKAPKTILMIRAKSPCKLLTLHGLGIGHSEADVIKAYKAFEDKENSKRGETFVAGSIYGGVIFTFSKGKVSEIFFGAAAE
jgi:hypothetical protein